jgi:hypothetical protein
VVNVLYLLFYYIIVTLAVKISPPCYDFKTTIAEKFNNKHPEGINRLLISMYALLLSNDIRAIKGWLAATHMLSLGGTGLGLIEWFFQICKIIQ